MLAASCSQAVVAICRTTDNDIVFCFTLAIQVCVVDTRLFARSDLVGFLDEYGDCYAWLYVEHIVVWSLPSGAVSFFRALPCKSSR